MAGCTGSQTCSHMSHHSWQQERTLASAFAASPSLASELALEARQWRQAAERAGQKLPKLLARPGSQAAHEQRRDAETEQESRSLWVLDLHQMSAASARVLLLRVRSTAVAHLQQHWQAVEEMLRIDEMLVQRLDQLAELVASEEHPSTPRPDGLEIITGWWLSLLNCHSRFGRCGA